jgi:hypothetical protein
MALFYECIQWCAHIVLDTADIVRDRDVTPTRSVSGTPRSPDYEGGTCDNHKNIEDGSLRFWVYIDHGSFPLLRTTIWRGRRD